MIGGVLACDLRVAGAQDGAAPRVVAGAALGLSSGLPIEMIAQLARELVVRRAGTQQLAQPIADAVDPGHGAPQDSALRIRRTARLARSHDERSARSCCRPLAVSL